jgi:CheY-like chemotaxis protein
MKKRNSHYSEVVVAEKNSEYRSSLCSVVASLNWLPIPTSSGLETMSAIKQGQIALVLLDVDLTFTDGENTLHEIRKVAPNIHRSWRSRLSPEACSTSPFGNDVISISSVIVKTELTRGMLQVGTF